MLAVDHSTTNKLNTEELDLFSAIPSGKNIDNFQKTIIQVANKTIIFEQGKKQEWIYTLTKGWAMLYLDVTATCKRQILRFLLPGDLFGLETISQRFAPQSSRSITDVTLCRINRMQLNEMLPKYPALSAKLIDRESHELCMCQYHLTLVGRKTAKERIAFLLLELFYRTKNESAKLCAGKENYIYFPLTQDHLADAVGLTSIHVHRVLKGLTQEKLISINKRCLTIYQINKLSRLAGFCPEMVIPGKTNTDKSELPTKAK